MKSGGGERKIRTDKKVDVKPTLSLDLKRQLYDFAELCEQPVKDIAERLCLKGLVSDSVIVDIRKWFRRNYHYNKNKIAFGYEERPRLKITLQGETGKVTMRLTKEDYDNLCKLAYALDITPSSTAAVLIRITTKNMEFMNKFVEGLSESLDKDQLMEVRRFANKVWQIQFYGGVKGCN